jgi:hypothetical protein
MIATKGTQIDTRSNPHSHERRLGIQQAASLKSASNVPLLTLARPARGPTSFGCHQHDSHCNH